MAKQRKQPAAQQPQAAGPAATPAVPAPVAAPAVVMLLAPTVPAAAEAPPVVDAPAVDAAVQPEAAEAAPLTDEDCAAFMGVLPVAEVPPEPEPEPPRMTAEQRENPRYLTGEALRALAHRRGIARSEAARMSDEKLREQLRYITAHQYETEAA